MRSLAQNPPQKTPVKSATRDRAHGAQGVAANPIHQLQRSIGNQAVQRMLRTFSPTDAAANEGVISNPGFSQIAVRGDASAAIQPKLTVNAAGDIYEQEVDRVAEEVTRMPDTQLQRACSCGGECPAGQNAQDVQAHLPTKAVQARDASNAAASALIQRESDPSGGGPAGATGSPIPKEIKFWINSFIPDTISGAKPVTKGTHAGKTMFEGPFVTSDCFLSDSRGFSDVIAASSRIHLELTANLTAQSWSFPTPTSSGTVELDCEDMDVECAKTALPTGTHLPDTLAAGSVADPNVMKFSFSASASDPCVTGAPEINMNGTVTIDKKVRTASFSGMIEPFPSFEAYVTIDGGAPHVLFTHGISASKSAWNLFGAADIATSGSVTF